MLTLLLYIPKAAVNKVHAVEEIKTKGLMFREGADENCKKIPMTPPATTCSKRHITTKDMDWRTPG